MEVDTIMGRKDGITPAPLDLFASESEEEEGEAGTGASPSLPIVNGKHRKKGAKKKKSTSTTKTWTHRARGSYMKAWRKQNRIEQLMQEYCNLKGGLFYGLYLPGEQSKTDNKAYFDIRAGDPALLAIIDVALESGSFTGWRSARAVYDKRRGL